MMGHLSYRSFGLMHTVSVNEVVFEQGTVPVGHYFVTGSILMVSRKDGPPRFAQAVRSIIEVILIGRIGGTTRPLQTSFLCIVYPLVYSLRRNS